MSTSFDPSPRASKRQKFTRSEEDHPTLRQEQSASKEKSNKLKTRPATRRKRDDDDDDSAYASKEDSLVEERQSRSGKAGMASTRSTRKTSSYIEPQASIDVYDVPEDTPVKSRSGQQHTEKENQAADSSSAKSKRRSRKVDEHATPHAKSLDVLQQKASEDQQQDDRESPQPRSSGRQRHRPRRFSDVQEELAKRKAVPSPVKKTIQVIVPKRVPKVATQEPESEKAAAALDPKSKQSAPVPKVVATPAKRQKTESTKFVRFDGNEEEIEQRLGFKTIDVSKKAKKSQKPASSATIDATVAAAESREEDGADIEKDLFQMPIFDDGLDDIPDDEEDLAALQLQSELESEEPDEEDSPELSHIKSQVLARLTSSQLPPLVHLEKEYDTLHALLSATITAGESNSLLVLGSRGVGKTVLLETALNDLAAKYQEDFHTVRLNGFFQTDDRLALREIWRQLGREMHVSEDETGEISSYADTMASLLSLLSHPDELDPNTLGEKSDGHRASKSIIFILDEFDLFTMHPRQTLLYNLFDIAQSRKAPIAVIGCSTRMDVVDCLEKRVKSRFSHRWFLVPSANSLPAFEDIIRTTLLLDVPDASVSSSSKQRAQWVQLWNDHIKNKLLPSEPIQALISSVFYSSKSIPDVFATLYPTIATLQLTLPLPSEDTAGQEPLSQSVPDHFVKPPSNMPLLRIDLAPSIVPFLPSLSTLHMSLVIAAARLETIHSLVYVNFNLVYAHYTELIARSRLQQTASGAVAIGGGGLRQWSREVAGAAWEDLARYGVVCAVSGAAKEGEVIGGGEGQQSRMYRVDVTLEEVEWAVKEKWPKKGNADGTGEVLGKWCREI